jgi:hypothetical protein
MTDWTCTLILEYNNKCAFDERKWEIFETGIVHRNEKYKTRKKYLEKCTSTSTSS